MRMPRGEEVRCPNCETICGDSAPRCVVCGATLPVRAEPTSAPATRIVPIASVQTTAMVVSPPRPHPAKIKLARAASVTALAIVLLAATGAHSVTFGSYQTSQANLESTRDELSKTSEALASTTVSLEATKTLLESTRKSLAAEQAGRANAEQRVVQLQSRVLAQDNCIQVLKDDVDELQRIRGMMSTNFNRTSTGSAWANAMNARNLAVNAALSDYYDAYKAAFDSFYGSANSWIALGNAQIKLAVDQLGIMNAQIDNINGATAQIDAALRAFSQRLTSSYTTCGI